VHFVDFTIYKHQMNNILFFTVVLFILKLSKFYYQLMYKRIALKGILKFTLKQLQQLFQRVRQTYTNKNLTT